MSITRTTASCGVRASALIITSGSLVPPAARAMAVNGSISSVPAYSPFCTASQRLGVEPEKVYSNISRVGNTSSASIPICLDECVRSGRIQKGDLVLMSAFGAGVTWGAVLMRW